MRADRFGTLCMALVFAGAGSVASAQDSVTVVADPELGKGKIRRFVLGDHYRELWLTPIRVPKLDLAREGGGSHPDPQRWRSPDPLAPVQRWRWQGVRVPRAGEGSHQGIA